MDALLSTAPANEVYIKEECPEEDCCTDLGKPFILEEALTGHESPCTSLNLIYIKERVEGDELPWPNQICDHLLGNVNRDDENSGWKSETGNSTSETETSATTMWSTSIEEEPDVCFRDDAEASMHCDPAMNEACICDICSKVFKQNDLTEHMYWHDGLFISNPVGGVIFAHEVLPEEVTSLHCSPFVEEFNISQDIFNKRQLHCEECEKSFVGILALREHYKSHGGEKPFVCNICGKRWKAEIDMHYHTVRHRRKAYSCNVCGKMYTYNNRHLVKHLRLHACDIESKRETLKTEASNACMHPIYFEDQVVGFAEESDSDLPFHKIYVCSMCSEAFEQMDKLNHHMSRCNYLPDTGCSSVLPKNVSLPEAPLFQHYIKEEVDNDTPWRSDSGPHACEICGRLIIHKKSHTGEKPYSCEKCAKSFACSSTLSRHRKIHSACKRDACEGCGKRHKVLFDHKRSHTRKKRRKASKL